eukprot:CAMPEP_0197891968 /NCGR_PEP_ID=MMETSP1439-20131203/29896_1 /TAXON_ID=66791 /ORGANISM="Gonyaulax spinifera, Strain CCMP409" /LENGTH=178 /DNA_ID=CAMNT_0043512109 /DNA_START=82 /DNA_END=618 /DNA_ORIENTATION=+
MALPLVMLALAGAGACWSWLASPGMAGPPAAFVSGAPSMRRSARAPAVAMQSEKVDQIVASLKELTLLEASELVTAIEETFGVDASASAGAVMMAAPGGAAEEDKPAEKTEFDVVLTEVPKAKKIAILKVVRGILGVGLKEAKSMVDNPGTIMEGKPKDICEDAKKQLEEAGATVELK